MRPPCEIIVSKILPVIRAVLVKDLIERHDFTQKEVSEKLGITQAAVSQYMSSLRGDKELEERVRDSEVFDELIDLSEKIAEEEIKKPQIIEELCNLCNKMRKEGLLCEIHSENDPGLVDDKCDICLRN